jgi:predicted Zn finger-like uncharacterized protein
VIAVIAVVVGPGVAMKFSCERCQTRYSIGDEKVRGKVLKIRCKTCGNIVVVREQMATALVENTAAAAVGAGQLASTGTNSVSAADVAEASRQIRTGQHQEWAKYVGESQVIQTPVA